MKNILLSFLILFSLGLFAQQTNSATAIKRIPKNSPTQKEKQKRRLERFAQIKFDSTISNSETARWKAFTESKNNLLRSQTPAPVANWQSVGPTNQAGRMITCAFDPTNSAVLYAGSASGGLWKTSNSGTSWTPLTDNLPSISIGAVAVNPQNNNEILIGTGEGYLLSYWHQYGVGVLKSTDGGLTWNPTGLAVADSLLFGCLGFAWDPINPNYVYLATTFGVYVSTDAGDNWTLKLPGTATSIEINKQNPNIIYAALQSYQTSIGGIYRSVDNGLTWQAQTAGLPNSGLIGFTTISICDNFPNVLYAGISDPASSSTVGYLQGLYKSSDAGTTWTLLPSSYDFYCYPAPNNNICQGWYANVTKVSPVDSNLLWAAGIFLYKSTDGGQTWNYGDYATAENPPWMHPDHHMVLIDLTNPNVMYDMNDAGVFRTGNGGGNWVIKNTGLVTSQFYTVASAATQPNLVMGGTQDNGIWYNNNISGSTSFNEFYYGDGFSCVIDHTNSSIMYGSELFTGRMRSRNGGLSHDTINTGLTEDNFFIIPLVMDPINNQNMFTATDLKIYKSIDSGSVWQPVYNMTYITILEIDPVNPNIIYGCKDPILNNSFIYRSMNGGTSWTMIGTPGNKIIDLEADPITSGVLYACRGKYGPGQQVYKSVDFGNSWTSIASGFPQIPANVIAINPNNNNHIYVGTDLGVYLSIDGGTTWASYNDNLPNVVVQDMHYYPNDSTIRCGTHGRGIWITKAADPNLTSVSQLTQSALTDLSCYPNPATNNTTISYSILKSCAVTIKIFNSLGQEVNQLFSAQQTAGKYTINWNCKNTIGQKVNSGIYYVRITFGDKALSTKVLIEK